METPAKKMTNMHVCPKSTGSIPHRGGASTTSQELTQSEQNRIQAVVLTNASKKGRDFCELC